MKVNILPALFSSVLFLASPYQGIMAAESSTAGTAHSKGVTATKSGGAAQKAGANAMNAAKSDGAKGTHTDVHNAPHTAPHVLNKQDKQQKVVMKRDGGHEEGHHTPHTMNVQGPRITMGGVIDTNVSYKSDEKGYEITKMPYKILKLIDETNPANSYYGFGYSTAQNYGDYSKKFDVGGEASLYIRAEADNPSLGGITYGVEADLALEAPKGKAGIGSLNSRGVYLFVDAPYGEISAGYQSGPETLMRIGASNISVGDHGNGTDVFTFMDTEGRDASNNFYKAPVLPTEAYFNGTNPMGATIRNLNEESGFESLNGQKLFRFALYGRFLGIEAGISYAQSYRSDLSTHDYRKSFIGGKNYKGVPGAIGTGGSINTADVVAALGATTAAPTLTAAADATGTVTGASATIPAANIVGALTVNAPVTTIAAANGAPATIAVNGGSGATTAQLASIYDSALGPDYENLVSGGLSYRYAFGDIQLGVSVVGEYAKAVQKQDIKSMHQGAYIIYNDMKALSVGASIDFRGIKVAGSYGYLGNSGMPKSVLLYDATDDTSSAINPAEYDFAKLDAVKMIDLNSSGTNIIFENRDMTGILRYKHKFSKGDSTKNYFYDFGAGYQLGNAYVSATYYFSDIQNGNEYSDIAVGVEYDLSGISALRGLSSAKFVPYASFHYVTTKQAPSNTLNMTPLSALQEKINTSAPNIDGVNELVKDLFILNYDPAQAPTVDNKGSVFMAGFRFMF